MFYSDGTVTAISEEYGKISLLIERDGVFDIGSTVIFDFSPHHLDELNGVSVGDFVSVHHWLTSDDGTCFGARELSIIQLPAAEPMEG